MSAFLTDPTVIHSLTKAYEKESQLRVQWLRKHKDFMVRAATLNREPTNYYEDDVRKHSMIAGMATITKGHVDSGLNRRKAPIRDGISIPCLKDIRHDYSIVDVGLGDPKKDPRLTRPDTSTSLDPLMRPINEKTKKILYKPRPFFGRERYLHERAEESPEKKYYFPECTSWDHGWRLNDSAQQPGSEHGRRFILWRTIHSSVGPQPDPQHYQSPEPPRLLKCPD